MLPSETAQKMVVSRIPLPLNNVSSSGITVLYGPWFTNVPRICETPGVFMSVRETSQETREALNAIDIAIQSL